MAICEQSIQGNSPTSTCFAADFLAKASRLRDGVSVSEIQELHHRIFKQVFDIATKNTG